MARTSIRRRLTLLFGVTILVVVTLLAIFVSRRMRSEMIAQAQKTALALAGSIAAASSSDFFNYNYVALEQKAEEAARDPEVAYVVLYDKEGQIAAFSGQGRLNHETTAPTLSREDLLAEGVLVREGLQDETGVRGLDVLSPVRMPEENRRWGTVRLGLRLEPIFERIRRTTLAIYLLGIGGTILGWFIASLFTRQITIPLKDLVNATVDLSRGKYDVDLEIRTGDEVQDLADNFIQMAGNLRDQKQALQANLKEIQELKHFSDLVMLSMTSGLMTLDEQGKVTTFNPMAERILAVPAEKALYLTPAEIWGGESAALAGFLEKPVEERLPASTREIRTNIGGEDRILGVSTAPIVEADERFRGNLVLIEDLTEKRALEDRLRRADRLAAMGTLASGLAHEIKNPLTAVRVFVQMFPERFQREDFREKFSRIVPRELDRVNDLLENLLDLVRKPRLRIQPLDAEEAIRQVLETLEPEAARRNVAVTGPDGTRAFMVLADESALARALHNLALNAIQAMPGGGQLTVQASWGPGAGDPETVEITVKDTGPGIPPDQIENIFNPFFTSKEKGTGLGLAVTNKIIEDQAGSLSLKSERGVGTSVTISLPAAGPGNGRGGIED